MQELNTIFRGVQKTTDVLSFPQITDSHFSPLTSHLLLGDIVINTPMAVVQARVSGRGFYDEIYRLLIHGILHLAGYDHEKSVYKADIMKKKEQEIFSAIKKVY